MTEQRTKVVRITMPFSYANEFIEESRLVFNDSRWLNMAFKHKMYEALKDKETQEIRKLIEEAKDELKIYITEMYMRYEK